jgi:hypothetical protein
LLLFYREHDQFNGSRQSLALTQREIFESIWPDNGQDFCSKLPKKLANVAFANMTTHCAAIGRRHATYLTAIYWPKNEWLSFSLFGHLVAD